MVKAEIQLVQDKDTFESLLRTPDMMSNLKLVATKYLQPEKIIKIALLAMSRNPKLLKCTKESFLQCIMCSAETGLDIASKEGYAYAIPYKNGRLSEMCGREVCEAQFIPGYKGYIEAAYRNQQIIFIDTQKVYEGDEFTYSLGSEPFIKHIPNLKDKAKKLICVYAIVGLKDSKYPIIEVMDIESINKIRQRSKAKSSGPWVTDFDEMARKCPVRRIWKRIPKTPEMKLIEETDQEYEFPAPGTDNAPQAGVNGLKERLKVESKEATPNPKEEAKAKKKAAADIKTTKEKVKKEKAKLGITEAEAEKTAEEKLSDCQYKCNYCKRMFNENESKKNPQGEILCPNCLTTDVTDTTKP